MQISYLHNADAENLSKTSGEIDEPRITIVKCFIRLTTVPMKKISSVKLQYSGVNQSDWTFNPPASNFSERYFDDWAKDASKI